MALAPQDVFYIGVHINHRPWAIYSQPTIFRKMGGSPVIFLQQDDSSKHLTGVFLIALPASQAFPPFRKLLRCSGSCGREKFLDGSWQVTTFQLSLIHRDRGSISACLREFLFFSVSLNRRSHICLLLVGFRSLLYDSCFLNGRPKLSVHSSSEHVHPTIDLTHFSKFRG